MRWLLAFVGLLAVGAWGHSAFAQPAGAILWQCGTNTYCPVSSGGPLPVNATVSASISGFTAATVGTPISVTTGGVSGTLPAGAVVVATNVGATNAAFCALGGSATTAWQYIAPGGGWFAYTVGASTQLTCITSTSTTTVNMVGGAGLPTGTGGSGGGGSGGNVTVAGPLGSALSAASVSVVVASDQAAVAVKQATASNLNAAVVGVGTAGSASGGVLTVQGIASMTPVQVSQATASSLNAAVVGVGTAGASSGGVLSVQGVASGTTLPVTASAGTNLNTSALALETGGNLATIAGSISSAVVQTNMKQVNGITTLTGTGATGTGAQRVTVATDTATIAGSAVGTAGTASANVVTVQGKAAMTPLLVTQSAPGDPCFSSAKSTGSFSSTTSGGSIVTAVSAKKIYVCQVTVVSSTAASVSFIEGTGSSICTGGTPSGDWLNTGTTAANGAPLAANGGISAGSGAGTVFQTATVNQNLCLLFSTTNTPTVVASVSYVQQ